MALWKLAAASPAEVDPAAGRAPRPQAAGAPVADIPLGPELATLFAAVNERRTVRFEYNGVERRVGPYRLSFRQGRWYLAGFDHTREAERLFRVDRIAGEVHVDSGPMAFEPPARAQAGPPPPWRLGDDEEVLVELRVDSTQADWALSALGDGALVARGADGSATMKVAVTNRPAFRTFVLGLLDHAEVLAPPDVRQDIVTWLTQLAGAQA